MAKSEAMFELIAQIAIPDGYPDKTCTFTLSVTPSSAHNQSKSKGAEEEKQTIVSFSKLSEQVEPVLAEMKKELEYHYADFCDVSKHQDFLLTLQIQKLKCCLQ